MAHTKYYTADGRIVPSVTTVISNNLGWNKNMLIGWTKKMALQRGLDTDDIVNDAAVKGTLAHYIIEHHITKEPVDMGYIKERTPDEIDAATSAFGAFIDWERQFGEIVYKHNEIQMVSEKYLFGGTIDCVYEKDGAYHILDIKTSNHLHPEMVIQLAAYKHMFEENTNKQIKTCSILKLDKKNRCYTHQYASDELIQNGWDVYLNLLSIDRQKPNLKFS